MTTTTINAKDHGAAAVELYENWHADCVVEVTDDRLGGEDYTCTVSQLVDLIARNNWNLHGYTVSDNFVRGQDGAIKIEIAE